MMIFLFERKKKTNFVNPGYFCLNIQYQLLIFLLAKLPLVLKYSIPSIVNYCLFFLYGYFK